MSKMSELHAEASDFVCNNRFAATKSVDLVSRLLHELRADPEGLKIAGASELLEVLKSLVEEFGGTIEQYHKIGPHFTFKDGTEVFDIAVVLDREPLIERARAAIAKAERS